MACNANTQERLNGELADRFRSTRGINSEDMLIFRVVALHHNFAKPHEGMDGRTPAEAAGIDAQGAGKWQTLMQNAAATTWRCGSARHNAKMLPIPPANPRPNPAV